jgi:hypothetical protein
VVVGGLKASGYQLPTTSYPAISYCVDWTCGPNGAR